MPYTCSWPAGSEVVLMDWTEMKQKKFADSACWQSFDIEMNPTNTGRVCLETNIEKSPVRKNQTRTRHSRYFLYLCVTKYCHKIRQNPSTRFRPGRIQPWLNLRENNLFSRKSALENATWKINHGTNHHIPVKNYFESFAWLWVLKPIFHVEALYRVPQRTTD